MCENPKCQDAAALNGVFDETKHYLDLPMTVMARLGNCNMRIREILELKRDSIIELPKSAGENIDIVVNGSLVAFGEVLDMEGRAGIRLTDLNVPL